ncbi:DUF2235 domain-containing protein [Methylobacterium oryzihabitans]|uniref:DUF2235 domain-containing protein n=1 Tax=Methylobacterium oryzihabitans TaxID=2499852 RepID=A0A3S2VYA6_9HYPH|nr:DUF2235 domain-containing protein [Methylobacterium oryzihabitans]RVU20553.1 DUF2235 domain-containing protein [Methylobacterium oryzihabitans]
MSKNLIVACDGTWNWPDQPYPTNVVKTVRALAPRDAAGNPQVVYYDQGVGSSGSKLRRIVDGALGTGLSQNVQDAYRFLADNYEEGDALFLFGFSRGAYTVRSLAGLLGQVGLLHKGDMNLFPDAYALYRHPRGTDEEKRQLGEAKAAFVAELCKPEGASQRSDRRRFPLVRFLGVWDTVGALGIPAGALPLIGRRRPTFHDTELNAFVENAYQALAIDEQREAFKPAIWTRRTTDTPPAEPGRPHVSPDRQVIEQRWFPGAHSNVGGGYEDAGLSDLAWGWMIGKARRHGLAFDEEYLARRLKPDPVGAAVDSWNGLPWTLKRRYNRTLCEQDSERLHRGVALRRDAPAVDGKPPYTPHPYESASLTALLGLDALKARIEDWLEPDEEPEGPPAPPSA